MKTETAQETTPATEDRAHSDALNVVGFAPGADRLDFIKGLIEPAESKSSDGETPEEEEDEDNPQETEPQNSDSETASDESPEETEDDAQEEQAQAPEGEEPIAGLPPAVQASINKRIGKEVARRKALEARIQELEKSRQQPAATPARAPAGSLDQVETQEDLQAILQRAEAAQEYADSALDRLEDDFDAVVAELRESGLKLPEEVGVSALKAELKTIRRNAERALRDGDKAARRITERSQFQRQIEADFEWAKEPDSPENSLVKTILDQFPEIRRQPNGAFAAHIYVLGLKAYQAMRASASKPAGKPAATPKRVPAQPGTPAASVNRPNGSKPSAATQAAHQAWLKDPTDREARIEALRAMGV